MSKVSEHGLEFTQIGTPYYSSPEIWRNYPYTAKTDMWSLGCVLYEIMALKTPFLGQDVEEVYMKVVKGLLSLY